jgi:transposase-like protein
MPAPYPEEFRREAVRLLKSSGKSVPQLASELGVSLAVAEKLGRPVRGR